MILMDYTDQSQAGYYCRKEPCELVNVERARCRQEHREFDASRCRCETCAYDLESRQAAFELIKKRQEEYAKVSVET